MAQVDTRLQPCRACYCSTSSKVSNHTPFFNRFCPPIPVYGAAESEAPCKCGRDFSNFTARSTVVYIGSDRGSGSTRPMVYQGSKSPPRDMPPSMECATHPLMCHPLRCSVWRWLGWLQRSTLAFGAKSPVSAFAVALVLCIWRESTI